MAAQKFTNFDFFLMHTDMTAVTIQSNKIVSNEVEDNKALLWPFYGKKQMNFLAHAGVTILKGIKRWDFNLSEFLT